jgi:hypothetical protein
MYIVGGIGTHRIRNQRFKHHSNQAKNVHIIWVDENTFDMTNQP